MPSPPPDPKQYRGKSFRSYLTDLVAWLSRSRIVIDPGSGLIASETPGGTSLRATGSGGVATAVLRLAKVGDTPIPARSGLTVGHGAVRPYTLNDDWTLTDTGEDVEVGNYTGGTIAANAWVAIGTVDGLTVIVSAEC